MKIQRVLLLNGDFEPIRIIGLHRAIMLIVDEKVDIIETNGEEEIRSPSITLPYPSVIRLRKYVKVPYRKKEVPISHKSVFNRDEYKCGYCLKHPTTIDHIVPRSRGGKHEWGNVVSSCINCNRKKSNKLLSEIGWQLKIQPTVPRTQRWLIVGLQERETWETYLSLQRA